jgi:4-amino-4-deoxy-L-arabinose transferase-like glycosyltransferase
MKPTTLFVLCLALMVGLASAWVSGSIFERLPHLEDEMTYLYQARMLARGDLFIPTPEPAFAYWQPFIIDCDAEMDAAFNTHCAGRRFGKYPPGWPLWLALGVLANAPWAVNALFAAMAVLLVYWIGCEVFDARAGAAAALLLTFSPISILLSGTMMSHSAAHFFSLLFVFSLWKLETSSRRGLWAAAGGAALGMVLIIRPAAAGGIATPLILYSLGRVILGFLNSRQQFWHTLKPLLVVTVFALLGSSLWLVANELTTGKAGANFYRMVWDYDRIGFGAGHGVLAEGHTLQQGWINLRQDSACYGRDLFGWALPVGSAEEAAGGQSSRMACAPGTLGVSWLLLPLGLLFYKRGCQTGSGQSEDQVKSHPADPLLKRWLPQGKWVVLMLLASASLIVLHSAYWIGAEVYSARYYFEASGLLALVSGAGFSALAAIAKRWHLAGLIYLGLAAGVVVSLFAYTLPRLTGYRGYGCISQAQIAEVESRREASGMKLLVIARGAQNNCPGNKSPWREIGALMAVSDPYLENEIILARDFEGQYQEAILQRFAARQVILMREGEFMALDGED